MILEGKWLCDLPWEEIDKVGPIELRLVPTVLKEVDKRKRDGRLGERARKFNRWVVSAATTGAKLSVRDADPCVVLTVATVGSLDAEKFADFDLADPDTRIVVEVLSDVSDESSDKRLISQDVHPLSVAFQAGLGTYHMPDAWLDRKDPSPEDREVTKLRHRVQELEATEPDIVVNVQVAERVTVVGFESLSPSEQSELFERMRSSKRRIPQHQFGIGIDHGYDDRFNNYVNKTLADFAKGYADYYSTVRNQIRFSVRVANRGAVRADRLIVQIKSSASTMHDKFVLIEPSGPPAPKLRDPLHHVHRDLEDVRPSRVGPHEEHLDQPPRQGGQLIEMHCEDFRNGRTWTFEGVLCLGHGDPRPAVISVIVTASNLHGDVKRYAKVEKDVVSRPLGELIDLENLRFVGLPHKESIRALSQDAGRDIGDVIEFLSVAGIHPRDYY